jgi:hypothetical protein
MNKHLIHTILGLLTAIFVFSCNAGEEIINRDYKLRNILTRGNGIWNIVKIEEGQITQEGNFDIDTLITPQNVYWQFLLKAEVVFGTEIETYNVNIIQYSNEGEILLFSNFLVEIEDTRISYYTGAGFGNVVIYSVEFYSKNELQLSSYSNVNGGSANKRSIYFEYCEKCEPVRGNQTINTI